MAKNPLAVALGKLGRGHSKTLSQEQRDALARRMREYHQRKAAEKAAAGAQNSIDATLSESVSSRHEVETPKEGY